MGREISSYGFEPNPRFKGKDTIQRPEEWALNYKRAKEVPGPGPEGPRMKEGALEISGAMQTAIDKNVRKMLAESRLGDDAAAGNPKAKVALERASQQLASDILAEMSAAYVAKQAKQETMTPDEMRAMLKERVTEYLTANQLLREPIRPVDGENRPPMGEEGSAENPLEMPSADEEEV